MLQCPTCGRQFDAGVTSCPDDGTPLRADSTVGVDIPVDPLVGRVLDDKYRLDARLGEGGMGTVYRATHLLIDRPVAVKVLNSRLVTDEDARERFRREARAAGRLQQSNAVAVTDFGETRDGLVYIVMELLEGSPLRELLALEAPLDPARAVSMMLQVSAAVAAAHEAGIIHRDLKPGNIFIVQRPHAPHIVKVLDFGIAKLGADGGGDANPLNTLTGTGVMIGTPRYMSPEQCDGAPLTPASDVYSMGVILYEMLTGQTPFNATTPLALALKHSSEQPRPLRELVATVPPALEAVVLHSLEKNSQERPADARAFRQELYEVAERLGLEHSAGFSAPTIENLRDAGTETPSGRLVIDIERLRQSRAASAQATSEDAIANTSEDEAARTDGGYGARAAAVANNAGASQANRAAPVIRTAQHAQESVRSERARRKVRVQVPLRRENQTWAQWLGQPPVLVGLALISILLIGSTVLLLRSRHDGSTFASQAGNEDDETLGRSLSPGVGAARGAKFLNEPRTPAEFYENGTYYFSISSFDAAARDFRRAIELQPEFPSAHNRLGRALMLKGQFAAAAQEFRTAVEQKGGNYPTAQYNLAFALQSEGDTEGAINAYREAIKNRGGSYADAYYQLGGIYLNSPGHLQEAVESLGKAVEQNNNRDPEAFLKLGVAYAQQKDYQNAETSFREAINQRGGDFAYAHYNLGLLLQTTDRPAEAIQEFETFLQQAPRDENRRRVENTLRDLRRRAGQ
ncbi:MAG: serine/threonine-protein kinase [Acidobacteria bacterium]|nr:serine/threonine-protein kinase [Acidobacteriota bacterium]